MSWDEAPDNATRDLTQTAWVIAWREHLCDLEAFYDDPADRIEALAVVAYDVEIATIAEEAECE